MKEKVKELQIHDKDTGSSEVQIAQLTGKIESLSKHIKQFKKDKDMRRTRGDGFKRLHGNGLKRPVIEDVHYSWNEFERLPKDVVIVYGFMIGCNQEYIEKLDKENFFVPKRLLKED